MIPFILLMCFVWSIADNILTNLTLRNAKKYHIRGIANREWYEWELNPIIRKMYKDLGLNAGFIISLVYGIVFLSVINLFFSEEVLWFALGALSIVIIIHIDNLRSIRRVVRK